MARVDKVQTCIFCGGVPCECPGSKASARKKLKPKAESVAPVTQTRADDWEPESKQVSRFKKTEDAHSVLTEDDLILREALRNLEPILSERDKRRFKDIIHPPLPSDTERRLIEWRQRNGKS